MISETGPMVDKKETWAWFSTRLFSTCNRDQNLKGSRFLNPENVTVSPEFGCLVIQNWEDHQGQSLFP